MKLFRVQYPRYMWYYTVILKMNCLLDTGATVSGCTANLLRTLPLATSVPETRPNWITMTLPSLMLLENRSVSKAKVILNSFILLYRPRVTQPDPPSRIQTLFRRRSKFCYSGRTLRQTQKAKLDRPDHMQLHQVRLSVSQFVVHWNTVLDEDGLLDLKHMYALLVCNSESFAIRISTMLH